MVESCRANLPEYQGRGEVMDAETLARRFHETYERLAPDFGYETRPETRSFNPKSYNGLLMIAVCGEVLAGLTAQLATAQQQLATMREALENWQNARNEMRHHLCLATVAKYEAARRDVARLLTEVDRLTAYADRLAECLTCLPKDVEVLRGANGWFAAENTRLTALLEEAREAIERCYHAPTAGSASHSPGGNSHCRCCVLLSHLRSERGAR
jgi:hypothetical protein